MLLGVRDGRAVAVQGDPDHPVNRGRLCPKGLSEHQMIAADGRLTDADGRRPAGDVGRRRSTAMVDGFQDAASTSTARSRWPSCPPASW